MKQILFFVMITVAILSDASHLMGQNVRPIRDDIGYCWDKTQLERFMSFLKEHSPGPSDPKTGNPGFVAGISPHDDYLYAGHVYHSLFRNINAAEVVIFGVTHSTVRKKLQDPHNIIIFDDYDWWQGPYSRIKISQLRQYLKDNLDKKHYLVSNDAHRLEHSIEGMVPFLQYRQRHVRITPIMITGMPFDTMTEISAKLATALSHYIKENNLELGKDIFFLISADANHYYRIW